MGICVPKHIVCDWYTPNFTAGVISCELKIDTENVARLAAGGTFFRSIFAGTQANSIVVSSNWQVCAIGGCGVGSPANDWIDYTGSGGSPMLDIVGVKLTITDSITVETYYAAQNGVLVTGGSPETTAFEWQTSAIDSLRSQVTTSSQLITMPTIDTQAPWNYGSPAPTDSDHLVEFNSNLAGGNGPSSTVDYLDAIRTGPALTMVYISFSDAGVSDGTMTELGEIRYWNGACWKEYNPTSPDCEDPVNVGSPEGSPRLFCELGPSSDCS